MTPSLRPLLLTALALSLPSFGGASVLVYSGFEGYPASGNVADTASPATGDTGLATGVWAGGNWSWQGSGLSWTNGDGTIAGGTRALDYTGSNFQARQVNVALASPIQQTVFIRLLGALDAASTTNRIGMVQFVINNNVTNNNNNFFPGFGMLVGGPDVTNGSNSNQFFAATNSTALTGAPTQLFGGTATTGANLLVGRLVWNPDQSKFTSLDVWANPSFGDLATPTSTLDISSLNIASLTHAVIRGGSANGGPRPIADELMIATAWDDVVVVPEPSVAAMLAIFATGALALRRRLRA